jgi:hypothetical protein
MRRYSARAAAGSAPITGTEGKVINKPITFALALPLAIAAFALPTAAAARDEEAHKRLTVTPYIEVDQVVLANLSPDNEVVTYTSVAAGLDLSFQGRNSAGGVSLRYEHRFGEGNNAPDGDVLSGIARISASVVPHTLSFEAGGLATQTRVEGNGSAFLSPVIGSTGKSNIYSAYGGPSLDAHAGDLDVEGHYFVGYTRLEQPDGLVTPSGSFDLFDDSVTQSGEIRVGSRPNRLLPRVGVGVGAGYYQEDISNLDQRVRDMWARGDVTVPVTPNVALVGGVGYEDVEVSSRDALRDSGGDPVVGPNGRYVTDPNSPRQLAYDVSGLIWDAGVLWRPSRRTSLEAHVGKRYGSISYYGTLAYQPNSRTSFNVSVYDNVAGFGGQVNRLLENLPTDFTANRNPISGDIGNCLVSLEAGSCLGGALGSVRSATFRARGVVATLAFNFGRIQTGIGGGYDRRKFLAAPGTVLASANGVIDQSYWLAAYLNARLDERSSISTNVYATWFQSGFNLAGDSAGYGASASYYRSLTPHLEARAAVSVDGVTSDTLPDDVWSAAALLGLRYSF